MRVKDKGVDVGKDKGEEGGGGGGGGVISPV